MGDNGGRWKPERGNRYYFVDVCGKAAGATCDTLERYKDRPYWFGNCYQTREEAEAAAVRVGLKAFGWAQIRL